MSTRGLDIGDQSDYVITPTTGVECS